MQHLVLQIERRDTDHLGCECVTFKIFPSGKESISEIIHRIPWWKRPPFLYKHKLQYHYLTRYFDETTKEWRYVTRTEGSFDHSLDPFSKTLTEFVNAHRIELDRLRASEPVRH